MRTRDKKTLVFGSQNSVERRITISAVAAWPGGAPRPAGVAGSEPPSIPIQRTQPVGDDILAERRGFLPRTPARGLVFAAVSVALIGVAAAGTYFFLGIEDTAKNTPAAVSTTTVTNAEMPAPAEATTPAPAPPPVVMPSDLPWVPPVVEAVKSPGISQPIEGAQVMPPARRGPAAPAPTATTPPPPPTATALETPAPPVEQRAPSAASPETSNHFSQPSETLTNPSGEPAPAPSDVLPNVGIKQ